MKMLWKGAAALALTVASLGAANGSAQARDDGWRSAHYRDDYRRDDRRDYRRDYRRDDRRWNNSRHWRDDRRSYRSHGRRDRVRCWIEWRYDRYRDRRVRARICR